MISCTCAFCQKKLSVKDDLAGKKVRCPGCGKVTPVPSRTPVPLPAVGPAGTLVESPPAAGEQGTASNPSSVSDAPVPPHPRHAGPDAKLTEFLAPPEAHDELGRLGGFRILEILGHGGMGVVFLAEDLKIGRKVAIKAMLPHLAENRSAQERFLREAKAAAALEHDHIVPIFHVGEDRGASFIVMPLLKGEPLDRRLQRDDTLPIPEVLRIGRELARGLATAHAAGLIHRDVKPANVWLEAPGNRVKILDFGLARPYARDSGLTQQGAIVGTPAYMSPEQARGLPLDHRSDLWSVGVVLYRICTGELPFQGRDAVSTLMAVSMTTPPAPIEINPEVPPGLSLLIMQLLEKDPARRIASAWEVVTALRQLEEHREATELIPTPKAPAPAARPTPPPARRPKRISQVKVAPPPARKSRGLLLAAVGVGLFCALAAGAFFAFAPPPPTETSKRADPAPTEPEETTTKLDMGTGRDTKPVSDTLWDQTPGPVVTLFNSKDLLGWRTTTPGKGRWRVEDAAITCEGPEDYLYTFRDDYADFHLRAEVKVQARANSGIFFRTGKPLRRDHDYEAQICNSMQDSQKTGSLYNRNIVKGVLVPQGDWFVYEVRAEGNRIRLIVNGTTTTDYKDPRDDYPTKGHIALQHLAGRVFFRKLELKELPPDGKAGK